MKKPFVLMLSTLLLSVIPLYAQAYDNVSAHQLYQIVKAGSNPYILDVRHPTERKTFYIKGSKHIPIRQLSKRVNEIKGQKYKDLYVISHSGDLSKKAAKSLTSMGFTKVHNVQGGMVSWASKSYPIKHHLGRGFENITVQELHRRLKRDPEIFILDVRTLPEYKNDGHIEDSTLIPIQVLARKLHEIRDKKNIRVYIICHTGGRSTYASDLLLKSGFKKVTNVLGGMEAWKRLNYPYKRN